MRGWTSSSPTPTRSATRCRRADPGRGAAQAVRGDRLQVRVRARAGHLVLLVTDAGAGGGPDQRGDAPAGAETGEAPSAGRAKRAGGCPPAEQDRAASRVTRLALGH